MKNFKYFFIFLFILSCGYSPIYQVENKIDLKLDEINFSGNKKISREIVKGLESFKKNNSNNVFNINFNVSQQESIVTKDKKGNPTSYKLVLEVETNLINKSNNKNYEKKFSKVTTYNSKKNQFELDQYKINLEKNMISQILQDMNIFLSIIGNDI
tara:strand:- start:67 stop:534 length:468 start_codon:yes stop_codon:yes gene_type:complete